jgi:hypothetical protein
MTQDERDQAAARVLLDIWKIFESRRMQITPYEKLIRIALAIHTLPPEVMHSIGVEVKQRRS